MGTAPSSSTVDARLAFGLLGFVVVITAVGARFGGTAVEIAWAVSGIVAVGGFALGFHRNRPRPAGAWLLIGAGLVLLVLGGWLWSTTKQDAHASWADLLYLAGYLPIVVGQTLLGRARGSEHTRDGLLDGAVFAMVALLLVWVLLIAPPSGDLDTLDRFVLAFYPLLDALLLMGIVWLALTPGRRSIAFVLLGTAYAVMLGADALWYLGVRLGENWTAWLDPLYPIGYALVAAAILHPTCRHVGMRPAPTQAPRVHGGRVMLLAASMFVGPTVAMVADGQVDTQEILVTVVSVLVVVAVILRVLGLVDETEQARHRFRLLAENVPSGVYEIGPDFEIRYANAEATRLFGRPIKGLGASDLLPMVDAADREKVATAARRLLTGDAVEIEFLLHAADGADRWVSLRGAWEQRGRADAMILGSTVDITTLKDAERVLQRQATHDPLTGLPNRRLLGDRLEVALARQGRFPGTLAVLFCDLDGFKTVNDVYGHDAGDVVLVEISRRLAATTRDIDTVSRLGGDEFVVVYDDAGTPEDVRRLAAKVVATVNEPVDVGEGIVSVGVSVGVCIAAPGDDTQVVLRAADSAMYRAKAEGRNRAAFASRPTALPEVSGLHRVGESDR